MHTREQVVEIPYLQLFSEENWSKLLPKKYLVKSHTFEIDEIDTEFLIDDCTNPDYSKFKINQAVNDTIKNDFNGQAFLKVYGRTAKDINHTMSKILNSNDLTMAIKMSQFLTEALDQELQDQRTDLSQNPLKQIKLKLILREYKEYLESPSNQFRLYFLNDRLVGVSQKIPNYFGAPANQMQINKAQEIGKAIYQAITKIIKKIEKKAQELDSEFVVDCFISESGSKGKILSIQPMRPLHSLSLFTEEQVNKIYEQAKSSLKQNKPIKAQVKYVKSAQEYKQVDLAYYRVGWELSEGNAFEEWKHFIKEK